MQKTGTQNLGLMVHDVARLLKSEFERRAREHSRLTLMQWRVLGMLSKADGQTQTMLAAKLEASPMTVSDIVDRLEGLGHLRREPDPADSRAKRVFLTESAYPLVEEMREVASKVYERALAGFDQSDRDALMLWLKRIADNLESVDDKKDDQE